MWFLGEKMHLRINIARLYVIILFMMPLVRFYDFLPFDSIYILLLLGLFLSIISDKDSIQKMLRIPLILYIAYVLVFSIISFGMINIGVSTLFLRLFRYILLIINMYVAFYRYLDFRFLVTIYRAICIFLTISVLFQYVMLLVGHPIVLLIPNIKVNGTFLSNTYIADQLRTSRFSSLFLEPAHQAQYMLPCLAVLLMETTEKNNKVDFKGAIIITIGLLASTSLQGYIGAAILWLFYLWNVIEKAERKTIEKLIVAIPVLVFVFYTFSLQPIIQQQFLKKLSSISNYTIVRGTSFYLRMIVGWECYGSLDLFRKIFGCGYSLSGYYLNDSGVGSYLYTDASKIGYMNGASQMLMEIGIFGTILYLIPFISMFRAYIKDKVIICTIITLVLFMFTCSCFEQINMYLPIAIIFSRVSYLSLIKRNKPLVQVDESLLKTL